MYISVTWNVFRVIHKWRHTFKCQVRLIVQSSKGSFINEDMKIRIFFISLPPTSSFLLVMPWQCRHKTFVPLLSSYIEELVAFTNISPDMSFVFFLTYWRSFLSCFDDPDLKLIAPFHFKNTPFWLEAIVTAVYLKYCIVDTKSV